MVHGEENLGRGKHERAGDGVRVNRREERNGIQISLI
jgi:hypothetical protein